MTVTEGRVNDMRLIDADALKEKLKKHHDFFVDAYGGFPNLPRNDKSRVDEITHCIAAVVNAPTIDAVPVVRCVNCIHYGAEASAFDAWTPFCLKHKMTTFPDDFCSYGERREGDGR